MIESTLSHNRFWRGKRVLLTGHTGFKGGWLALWLHKLGAEVIGIGLLPDTEPSLFHLLGVEQFCESHYRDIRDAVALAALTKQAEPEIVFHLAAQPLVRASYRRPVETFDTNIMGTVHVLEALRGLDSARVSVMITTDKVYRNNEWTWPYREEDVLGGHDPYSASKAASEIVIASYRDAFFGKENIAVASARAGNVIGGGDWAEDRLVPDFFRAVDAGKELVIRYPSAVRPWQHVLEPLAGYLNLAERLFNEGEAYAGAWNFGPEDADSKSVGWIVEQLCSSFREAAWHTDSDLQPHEAHSLKLDISKAKARLGWRPCWDLKTALDKICDWHKAWKKGEDMKGVSLSQIHDYENAMKTK